MKQDLIKQLKKSGVVRKDKTYVQACGEKTDHYIDLRLFYGVKDGLNTLTDYLWDHIDRERIIELEQRPTGVAAEGYDAVPLAAAIASRKGLTLTMIRDEAKDHGTKQIIEGHQPTEDDMLIVVEGVTAHCSTFDHVLDVLEPTGAKIFGCYAIVARDTAKEKEDVRGIPLTYILTDDELI